MKLEGAASRVPKGKFMIVGKEKIGDRINYFIPLASFPQPTYENLEEAIRDAKKANELASKFNYSVINRAQDILYERGK